MSSGLDDSMGLVLGQSGEEEKEASECMLAGLEDLPPELLIEVFKRLDHFTDAHAVMLVCWSWYRAAHNVILMDPKPPLSRRQMPAHYKYEQLSPDFHSSQVYRVDRTTNVYYVHVQCRLLVSHMEKMRRIVALMGIDGYLRWELQWDLFDGQGVCGSYSLDAPEEEYISGVLQLEELESRFNALSKADRNIVDAFYQDLVNRIQESKILLYQYVSAVCKTMLRFLLFATPKYLTSLSTFPSFTLPSLHVPGTHDSAAARRRVHSTPPISDTLNAVQVGKCTPLLETELLRGH